MKDHQLPDPVHKALEQRGLKLNVKAWVRSDMDREGYLGQVFAVLTLEGIWIISGERADLTDFGGSNAVAKAGGSFIRRGKRRAKEASMRERTPMVIKDLAFVALADLKSIELLNEVVGGLMVARINDEERWLLRFSGSRFKAMAAFTKDVQALLTDSEAEADDGKAVERFCPTCGRRYPDENRAFCPHCLKRKSVFIRLVQKFKPYRLRLFVLLAMIGLAGAFNAFIPYLTGTILYDRVLGQDPEWLAALGQMGLPQRATVLLLLLAVVLALTKLLQQLTGILHGRQTAYIVPGVIAAIKSDAFDALQKLSLSFFSRRQTGSLMQRINGDAEEVTSFFIDGLPYLLFNVLTISVTAIIMFRMNPLLAIMALFLLPPLFVISFRLIPTTWQAHGRRSRARRRVYSILNDTYTGARVVRAFGQEEQQNQQFDKVNQNLRDAEINVMKAHIRYEVPYNLGRVIPNLLVWVTGAILIIFREGTLEYGQLLTFVSYLAMMQGPMQFFSMIFVIWSESMNAAQRMFEIIDARPDIVEKEHPLDADLSGAIELRHVSFGYEINKPILKDINFKIQAGEMLGIVGKSGAGKSTLVNLIARLYDISEGQVLLDDHDVRDLSFKSLHGAVAMVSQETYIFMGTIAENIAYARPEAARQDIVDAAIAAHAHQFICKLPDGYDTLVGTGGRQLSGGERQRLSIARAILANPKILVLDEATASVDTETERAIQTSLNELVKGRTTLSIAHRLSTLKGADRIIVLENGRLTEAGTHQELIAKRGAYFNLMELQTKALAMRGVD